MLRFDCSELSGPEAKTRLVGTPTGYIGSEQGGQLTRPVMANPRRLILFDEIEKAYPPVFDLFLQLLGEGRLTEQGSGKVVNYTQCLFILTSNAHAEAIGKIQAEMSDYHEMLNAVKGELAEAKVFRPEILGRIDKVYVFRPLEGMVVAEIALLKISKLAREYGLEVEFVAPELILRALMANEKVSRFGIRELERILFDLFANQFIDAKEGGAKRVRIDVDDDKNVRVTPASDTPKRLVGIFVAEFSTGTIYARFDLLHPGADESTINSSGYDFVHRAGLQRRAGASIDNRCD